MHGAINPWRCGINTNKCHAHDYDAYDHDVTIHGEFTGVPPSVPTTVNPNQLSAKDIYGDANTNFRPSLLMTFHASNFGLHSPTSIGLDSTNNDPRKAQTCKNLHDLKIVCISINVLGSVDVNGILVSFS